MEHSNRKVEYLMTYGWIALVLSVVGLAALGLLSEDESCLAKVSGFESPVTVTASSSNGEKLNVTVNNVWPEPVVLNRLDIIQNGTSAGSRALSLDLDSESTTKITGLPVNNCDSHEVEISYTVGNQSYTSEGLLS